MKTTIKGIIGLSTMASMIGCGGSGTPGYVAPSETPDEHNAPIETTISIAHGFSEDMCIDVVIGMEEGLAEMREHNSELPVTVVEYEMQPNSITCGDYGLADMAEDIPAAEKDYPYVCMTTPVPSAGFDSACVITSTHHMTQHATTEEQEIARTEIDDITTLAIINIAEMQ